MIRRAATNRVLNVLRHWVSKHSQVRGRPPGSGPQEPLPSETHCQDRKQDGLGGSGGEGAQVSRPAP